MRLVLAHVKPFAEVVSGAPGPTLIGRNEPRVVLLAEFCESLFADLMKNVDVVIAIVAFDGGATCIAEVHGRFPFLLDIFGPGIPLHTVESIQLVIGLCSREVEHERANCVRILVEKENRDRIV